MSEPVLTPVLSYADIVGVLGRVIGLSSCRGTLSA